VTDQIQSDNADDANSTWWREPQWMVVVGLVLFIYFLRLDFLPMVGEEARWARGAVQMVETGDWVVARQQLIPFPERPPMSSWAMALVGLVRGEVDPTAARLPSVLAIMLTSILVYAYTRGFLGRLAATAASLAYATFGQVLQIGRHGESEALFTLFVTASLLAWHYGYEKKWRATLVWSLGYLFMALAALVKGPQAPVYFVAVIGAYLLLIKRDWRYLLRPAHGVGILVAASLLLAWQAPYYLMTDADAVRATWGGLAGDRFQLTGLLKHVASYPLETFVCLLPWSPLLFALASKRFRVSLSDIWPLVGFLAVALLVTYPSVLFASHARGRYFMPMYPCIAVLLGVIVERSVAAAAVGSFARMSLRNFFIGVAVAAVVGGVFIALLSGNVLPDEWAPTAKQPMAFAIVFLIAGLVAAAILTRCALNISSRSIQIATVVTAAFIGLAYTGVVMNAQNNGWNNPRENVTILRSHLPHTEGMSSFGPIDFRFCYYYKEQISQRPWPKTTAETPDDLEYFFLAEHPGDTDEYRMVGRGRTWGRGPAHLPFEWVEVDRISLDRRKNRSNRIVILAKVVRDPNGRLAERQPRTSGTSKLR
jgi:4-amino-4-deoxy-L-arabinose transferase-like glycosyltransferase